MLIGISENIFKIGSVATKVTSYKHTNFILLKKIKMINWCVHRAQINKIVIGTWIISYHLGAL